jgi:predicted DNA-binding ribbon-helix-helix protein
MSLAGLVAEIDRDRLAQDPPPNLSSAARVFALEHLRRRWLGGD